MKNNRLLVAMSLISIVLISLHITDDIVRGISPPARNNLGGVAIFVVWLAGTLMLGDHRVGYVIMLLGGLFAAAMPVLHMGGRSYLAVAQGGGFGGFFFVWTLFAVGTTGVVSMLLAVRALWSSRKPAIAIR